MRTSGRPVRGESPNSCRRISDPRMSWRSAASLDRLTLGPLSPASARAEGRSVDAPGGASTLGWLPARAPLPLYSDVAILERRELTASSIFPLVRRPVHSSRPLRRRVVRPAPAQRLGLASDPLEGACRGYHPRHERHGLVLFDRGGPPMRERSAIHRAEAEEGWRTAVLAGFCYFATRAGASRLCAPFRASTGPF